MASGLSRLFGSWFPALTGDAKAEIQIQVLSDVAKAVASSLDGTESAYHIITEAVTGTLSVEYACLYVPTADGDLRQAAASGIPPGDPAMTKQVAERAWRGGRMHRDLAGGCPAVAAPLKHQNNVIGVIVAHAKRDGSTFSSDELRLIEVLATLAALLAAEAKLIGELSRRNKDLELVFSVVRKVNSEAASDAVLAAVLNAAMQRTKARSGSLISIDPKRGELVIRAAEGLSEEVRSKLRLSIGQGVTGWVAREGKSARIEDVRADARYVEARSAVRSELAVPIRTGADIFGVLNVDADTVGAFSAEDQAFLEALADLAAARIRLALTTRRDP